MRIGTLVKHIEWETIGVALQQGVSTCDKWLIQFSDGTFTHTVTQTRWCMERELEVLSESR